MSNAKEIPLHTLALRAEKLCWQTTSDWFKNIIDTFDANTENVQRSTHQATSKILEDDDRNNPRIRRLLAERRRKRIKQQRESQPKTPTDEVQDQKYRLPTLASNDDKFDFRLPSPNTVSRLRHVHGNPQPIFGLTAARADPFKTLPVQWSPELDENFDFLVNSFGPTMFGYRRNDQRVDIFRNQAQLTLADPAAFHALMTLSTQTKDRLGGRMLPGVSAVWHRVEALRMVNERFARGDLQECLTEGSIFAVMVLTGISRQWNAVGDDEFQSTGLDRLVLKKGGLAVIGQQHPVLELAMFCLAVLTPGMLRPDLYAVGGLDASLLEDVQDSKSLLYSLLGFVRSVESWRNKNVQVIESVRFAFAPGTVIHRLLTNPPDTPGIHPHKMTVVHGRLWNSILLYIFSVLIYGTPAMFASFTQHLQVILKQSWIWKDSLRMLQWLIVANPQAGTMMFPRQAWQSYEQLCALGSLEGDLQQEIRDAFLKILTGPQCPQLDAGGLMSKIRSQMFATQAAER